MSQSNGLSEMTDQNQTPANSGTGRPRVNLQEHLARAQRVENAQGEQTNVSRRAPQAEEPEAKVLNLRQLFATEDDSGSENSPDDPSKPVDSIDKLVKRLKVKPEDVYSIKVPMKDGAEAMSIGQLKDRVGELVELETRQAQFDQRRIKAEGELLRAQSEMRELMALIPREQITPDLVNRVRKKQETTLARERELTLEHIPDWQDQKVYLADKKGMNEMLSNYGFDESFLETVVDHRAMKFIRDAYLTHSRIQKALKDVEIPVRKGQRPSAKAPKPATRTGIQQHQSNRAARREQTERSKIMGLFNKPSE